MPSKLPLLAATLVLLAASGVARAAPVMFDFENLSIGTQTPFTTTSGGLSATFAGPAGIDPDSFEISFNSSSGPLGVPYRTLKVAFLTTGGAFGAAGSALTVSFGVPVSSISLLFALDDPGGTASLSLATDAGGGASTTGELSPGFRYPEGLLAFTGAPFTTVTLSSTAQGFQIDDLVVTPVPEPASLMLLGGAVAGASLLRRRLARPG